MIVNRVPELVAQKFGKKRINVSQIQKETLLTYSTVQRWVYGEVDRIDTPVLEAWCRYLGVQPGDILVYKVERKAKED